MSKAPTMVLSSEMVTALFPCARITNCPQGEGPTSYLKHVYFVDERQNLAFAHVIPTTLGAHNWLQNRQRNTGLAVLTCMWGN